MSVRVVLPALAVAALVAACGGGSATRHATTRRAPHVVQMVASVTPPPRRSPAAARPFPRALVTAETENRLLVVALPRGRVVRRVALPTDPEDLAADTHSTRVAVTSAAAGKVTILDGQPLRPIRTFGGFEKPHIVAFAPDGATYVTDDASGTLTVIAHLRVTSTIRVGAGAHHLDFDLFHQRAWVALGESTRTIVILDTSDFDHPRVIGRFDPGFPAHDLAFSPDGQRVWVTSASGADAAVFGATDRRVRFRVPVGPPPQHVAFDGTNAYLTSGYGGTIEKVDGATGRVLARASAPYGSFELAAGRYVVTSSLLRGTLAIYTPELKLLRVVHLAPATREVALSPPA